MSKERIAEILAKTRIGDIEESENILREIWSLLPEQEKKTYTAMRRLENDIRAKRQNKTNQDILTGYREYFFDEDKHTKVKY